MLDQIEKEKLNYVYHVWGWKGWIYDLFMKFVYPDINKGWATHKRLIESKAIIHFDGKRCIICQ